MSSDTDEMLTAGQAGVRSFEGLCARRFDELSVRGKALTLQWQAHFDALRRELLGLPREIKPDDNG